MYVECDEYLFFCVHDHRYRNNISIKHLVAGTRETMERTKKCFSTVKCMLLHNLFVINKRNQNERRTVACAAIFPSIIGMLSM